MSNIEFVASVFDDLNERHAMGVFYVYSGDVIIGRGDTYKEAWAEAVKNASQFTLQFGASI